MPIGFTRPIGTGTDPFIHIASVRERRRSDKIQTVTVYTNLPVAELCVNGVSLGTRVARNGVMKWDGVQLRLARTVSGSLPSSPATMIM